MFEEIIRSFPLNGPFFVAQLLNFVGGVGLYVFSARLILQRAKGLEVPIWLLVTLVVPVIMPIIAFVYFWKQRVEEDKSSSLTKTEQVAEWPSQVRSG